MVTPGTLLKASFDASKQFFRMPAATPLSAKADPPHAQSIMVPIRSIGPDHNERITAHLLSLSPADRYLRFGYAANDEQIRRYVDGLNYERDDIFGI